MLLGRVIGTVVSTFKHPSMVGSTLLVVQPFETDGTTADGYPQIAVDGVGAGTRAAGSTQTSGKKSGALFVAN